MAENFARRLEASSRRTPEKPALVWDDAALTFGELDRRADAFATRLASTSVTRGDRIALTIGNHWAFAVALLAGWKLGVTVAPLDTLLKPEERADILADLAPALVIDETDRIWIRDSFDAVIADCHRVPGAVWDLGRTLAGHSMRSRARAR